MSDIVKNNYEIDFDVLQEKAETSDYWKNAADFVERVWEKPFASLSEKEQDWLEKIEKQL